MNKNILWILLIPLLSFSKTTPAKSNVDVVTTVSVGDSNLELNLHEFYSIPGGAFDGDSKTIKSNPNAPEANIGITVLDDRFYYGFTMLITGQGIADYQANLFDSSASSTALVNSAEIITRTSQSAYLGYALTGNLSVYGGIASGSGGFGNRVRLNEDGPFLGARYVFHTGSSSSLTFDVAYSNLKTDLTLADGNFIGAEHTYSLDSEGLSTSITWLKSLDRGRSFFIRFKMIDMTSYTGIMEVQETIAFSGQTGTA